MFHASILYCNYVPTTRRTVYLDLNHWYMLGEALAGHPRQREHVVVLRQLAEQAEQERLMFPLSAVHYMELAENPRDHQRQEAARVMMSLSRFNTITSTSKILDEELALALNSRFGRPAFPVKAKKFGFGANFAFSGIEKVLGLTGGTDEGRREVEARVGKPLAQWEAEVILFSEYELLKQPSAGYRNRIPGYDPYAARRTADEELESFNVMLHTLRTDSDIASRPLDAICGRQFIFEFLDNYTRALLSAGFNTKRRPPFSTREQLTDFLMSLPSRRVAAMIQFHYLRDVRRDWTINDLRDIAALAKAIPYCDIVVTDKKAWDVSVNRAHLDSEFSTHIFRRLTDLGTYLQDSVAA